MTHLAIYTDCSFDPKTKIAVGASALYIHGSELLFKEFHTESVGVIHKKIFNADSCGKGELLTMTWALVFFEPILAEVIETVNFKGAIRLDLYTDSKTLAELPQRREKLERNQFLSQKTGKMLSQGEIYKKIYEKFDELNREFQVSIAWVKGHTKAELRSEHEQVISELDKAARSTLRELIK